VSSRRSRRIDVSTGDLAELRALLADLRRHADAVRLEAAVR
jgi:hypothetical protein